MLLKCPNLKQFERPILRNLSLMSKSPPMWMRKTSAEIPFLRLVRLRN